MNNEWFVYLFVFIWCFQVKTALIRLCRSTVASSASPLPAGASLQRAASTSSVSRATSCCTGSTAPGALKGPGLRGGRHAFLSKVRAPDIHLHLMMVGSSPGFSSQQPAAAGLRNKILFFTLWIQMIQLWISTSEWLTTSTRHSSQHSLLCIQ